MTILDITQQLTMSPHSPNTEKNTIQRIGVIGGGQLAWMMTKAAESLAIELVVQTPHATDPAAQTAANTILAPIQDASATASLAAECDIITFENEFVNLDALQVLANDGVIFTPSLSALSPLLDKYDQRCYVQNLGLPTPQFITIAAGETIKNPFGFPVVVKARRHGYDGQGTFIVNNQAELEIVGKKLQSQNILIEEFVDFDRELAVIAARSNTGELAIYPIVETQQENQVCHLVFAPATIEHELAQTAANMATILLESLQFVGLLAIELFLTTDGKLLVNEIAPRTHNSGHFTIDACETSQFEMHLRAISNLPLGNPNLKCPGAMMVNLLGYESSHSDYRQQREKIQEIPFAHVHWYGKTESRSGRKLGHVTVLLHDLSSTKQKLQALAIADQIKAIWQGRSS